MKNRTLLIILFSFNLISIEALAACNPNRGFFGGFLCRVFTGQKKASKADRTSGQTRRAKQDSEGRYDIDCEDCRKSSLRKNMSLSRIPQNSPATGVIKVMQNMFRTCNISAKSIFPYNSTCRTDSNVDKRIQCRYTDQNKKDVVLTPAGSGAPGSAWMRKINPSFKNVYQASNQCSSVVNGVNYAKARKTFAMPSNFVVKKTASGRPVINLDNCGTRRKGGKLCGIESGSVPTLAPECFKMLHTGFLANCLKFHPDEKVVNGSDGEMRLQIGGEKKWIHTGLGTALTNDKNSCLGHANVNLGALKSGGGTEPLLSGDMIIDSENKHSWMITKVGRDPLGVADLIKKGRNCSSLNLNDFKNFEIAQSTGRNNAGPIVLKIGAYDERNLPNGASVSPIPALLTFAKRMCEQAKTKSSGVVPSKNFSARSFSISRHKSVSGQDPEGKCRYKADKCPKINGDECGKSCVGKSPAVSFKVTKEELQCLV